MPLVPSSYNAYLPFRGLPIGISGHLSTIYPTLFRRVSIPPYQRERLELTDGDFLDLDWLTADQPNKKLAILSHGLEGSSHAHYIRALAQHLHQHGHDVLAWSYRGCSGTDKAPEPNRLLRSYHSGVSDDLELIVHHAIAQGYTTIALIGFSLGGNITLKYLGEQNDQLPKEVKAAIAFSVPCDLASSALRLGDLENQLYMRRFMHGLTNKIRHKAEQFPKQITASTLRDLENIKTFAEFDDRFTAPLNGFQNAQDYWTKASSLPHLSKITIPTLLVQALDDPFLTPLCIPTQVAKNHTNLHLETPVNGGHVGFIQQGKIYYAESRTFDFLDEKISC